MAQPRRILVVDDDAAIRVVLTTALAMEGYAVRAAADGAAALKHGGIGVPILALSAGEDPEAAAREIGAADWLAKPFELVELLAKVARLCPPA